jgi:hypothetical protein
MPKNFEPRLEHRSSGTSEDGSLGDSCILANRAQNLSQNTHRLSPAEQLHA